jgi:hypothetical protein
MAIGNAHSFREDEKNTKLHGLLDARASPHWRMPGAERTMRRLLMGYGSSDREVSVAIRCFHTAGLMLGIGVVPLVYSYI